MTNTATSTTASESSADKELAWMLQQWSDGAISIAPRLISVLEDALWASRAEVNRLRARLGEEQVPLCHLCDHPAHENGTRCA